MQELLTFVIASFLVYRVTRFVLEDSLLEEPRHALHHWCMHHNKHYWARKLFELTSCAYCMSIWVAGFAVLFMRWWTNADIPMPVFYWPALSGSAVVIWRYVESE